jgi:ABC-type Fe3+ transport system substrate-binding protein
MTKFDGKRYGITEKFGYNTIGFNKAKVDAADMQSLSVLTNDKYKGRVAIYDYYLPVIGLAAMSIGKKTPDITEAICRRSRKSLLKMKANAKAVTDVVSSQTALATGEADVLVGGGEWVSASSPRRIPTSISPCRRKAPFCGRSRLAMFKDSKNPDLALKFIQYVLSPEGPGAARTFGLLLGHAANTKARSTDEQKTTCALPSSRFLKRAQPYPAPSEDLDKKMQDVWTEMIQRNERPMSTGRKPIAAWASVITVFAVDAGLFRRAVRGDGVASLFPKGEAGLSLANYAQFFTNPSYWRSLTNSLEVTLTVHRDSVLLAIPSPGSSPSGAGALAATALDAGGVAVLDLLRGALLFLAAGAGGEGCDQRHAAGIWAARRSRSRSPTRRAATVIGFVHFFVMLLTLTIFANLKQLSPNYRKAAADPGAGPIRSFIHVHPAAHPAGIMVGRVPDLRAGDRRLHHAADPGRR